MKKIFTRVMFTNFLVALTMNIFAQVGIGPGSFTPNASAGLDIDFTNKGLLIPRVDLATAFPSIAANAAGLMVYNTNAAFGSGTGIYYNTSMTTVPNWVRFGNISGSGSSEQVSFWSSGNSLSGDNNLVWDFTRNRLGIGDATPNATLHIKGNLDAALRIDPFGESSGNTGELRFYELAANGINYSGFKAQDVLGGNMIWSLPAADGTNGQVLSTNGSGVMGWADNNAITGTGSSGKIAYWSGTNVLSYNTNLHWDNANSRLGIGTASPNANTRLDVNSTSLYSGYFTSNSSSDNAHVIHSEYTGTASSGIAVYGKSVTGNYGIGGSFEGKEYGGYFTGGSSGIYVYGTESSFAGCYIAGGPSTQYGLYVDGNDIAGTSYGISVYANGEGGTSHYGIRTTASFATTNYGIYAYASGGTTDWAGYFSGDVNITGTLSKGGGSFRIDHPQDPENKLLYHSFVESPDMKNVYDGVAVLDENGTSTVELPSYFEALNKDFRYQLTAMGAPGPNLYIAEKVHDNVFKIAGGTPGMEVSWQVTGIRKDPFAEKNRIPVEVDKTADERGKYLYPAAYGLPEERGIDFENNKITE